MEDLKEKYLTNVLEALSSRFQPEELTYIQNVLVAFSNDYDFTPNVQLPSTEVVDNRKILNTFLALKKMGGRTEETLRNYAYTVGRFLEEINIPIRDITTSHVRYYIAKVGYMQKKNSNSYMDDIRRVLNTFFTFCETEDYIAKNPCRKIEKIKTEKTMESPYSDTEIVLLREAATDGNLRDQALVDFLLSTGARRDEVRKIKLKEVDFSERSVLLHGKGQKDRYVSFSAKTERSLNLYLASKKYPSEYLFSSMRSGDGLSKEYIGELIRRIGIRSDIDGVHTHRFRKSFGTYMSNNGVPIQDLKEMMGHAKLDTTNSYYVFANQERIKTEHKNRCL